MSAVLSERECTKEKAWKAVKSHKSGSILCKKFVKAHLVISLGQKPLGT